MPRKLKLTKPEKGPRIHWTDAEKSVVVHYAAGAYLSGHPVQTGSLRGQDVAKCVILFLILCGIVQQTLAAFYPQAASLELAKVFMASWDDCFTFAKSLL